mgnify:FL=1
MEFEKKENDQKTIFPILKMKTYQTIEQFFKDIHSSNVPTRREADAT